MCGIAGFAGLNDKDLLGKMCDVISHRGPNDKGYFLDKDIGLGNRRLSIIDIKGGHQPIHNEDESIWITFNGEIYNFLELKKELESKGHKFYTNSDTEVIIHTYEEYGYSFVEKLRGIFAFAIWDDTKKQLLLVRDRLGVKPLYYTIFDGKILFGSEIKSILQYNGVKRKINFKALNYFLTLRYVPGPDTIFDKIHKLQPSNILIWRDNKISIKRYWSLKLEPSNYSENFYTQRLYELLKEAVRTELMSEVPLGVYLSGGIDSTVITTLMSQVSQEEIKTFSVGFGDERTDELNYARIVSENFGTSHNEFIIKPKAMKFLPEIIWHFDEPIADPAAIPVYLLSELAKKYVTVVLTGEGGDELFAGYEQYKILYNAKKYTRFIPNKFISKVLSVTPESLLDHFFKYSSSLGIEGKKRAIGCFDMINKDILESYLKIVSIFDDSELKKVIKSQETFPVKEKYEKYFKNVELKNILNKLLLLETEIQLPDNFLMKDDKMTMAYSIEARVPLLDHKLVEFVATIPPSLKLRGMKDKYILRKLMSKFTPVIMKRKKQRFFVPIDTWLGGELWEVTNQILSKENIEKTGIFNYNYIKHIIDNFKTSKLFYSRQIWNLLNFEIWRRVFIEERDLKSVLD